MKNIINNLIFPLYSRILVRSAILLVAGFLYILLPNLAHGATLWGQLGIGQNFDITSSSAGGYEGGIYYNPYSDDGTSNFANVNNGGGYVLDAGSNWPDILQIKYISKSGTCANIASKNGGNGIGLVTTDGNGSASATGGTDIGGNICQYSLGSGFVNGRTISYIYIISQGTGGDTLVLDGSSGNDGFSDDQDQSEHYTGGIAFQYCKTTCDQSFLAPNPATVEINYPADGSTVNEFQNFSVSYSGVSIPTGQHEIYVYWSTDETLLDTCINDPFGSQYYGMGFESSVGYTTCTNSVPRVRYDGNGISFSSGITSYTGSVPKSASLVNGDTYYAIAVIRDDDGYNVEKSSTVSFTMSGGVPVVNGSGTITNTAGDGTITGTGTHFLSTLAIGDTITVGGQSCVVQLIVSDTELECTPLTSAHTTQSYTQNSEINLGLDLDTCSGFDVACYLKNVVKWFFGVSPATLQNFSTLTLENSIPFSYIYDMGNVWNELFANGGSMSYSVSATTPIGTIDFISASAISAVPYASTIKTIIGYLLYFMTAMTLYHLLLRVHSGNH